MTVTTDSFPSLVDGTRLATYAWLDASDPVRGVVQIAHGLAEHSARYNRLAAALNAAGYLVHAADHRGHGKSIVSTPGDFGSAGFHGLIADIHGFGASLADQQPELPLFLLAHSMGSFAAQSVVLDHSGQYAGVVLTGSTALDLLVAGLAEAEGPVGLAAFNAGFERRTGFEWLSRDEAEVDAYVADPLCGFDAPDESMQGMFAIAPALADPSRLSAIRPDLPILIASGQADPLSGGGQLVDVTVTVYPDARHEIFNETNRDEVTADVITWLQARS